MKKEWNTLSNAVTKSILLLLMLPLLATSFIWLKDIRAGDPNEIITYAPVLLVWMIVGFVLLQGARMIKNKGS
ncbi:hypothetical protein [Alteribacter populi]|uniref:hypothetical protein n=1 Tax=Alteribacter populi TaxID=2011011 RepID=UPI000BBB3A09|nr:hypothetical protein [Alteribacter populi]